MRVSIDRFTRWLAITPRRGWMILFGLLFSTAAFTATGDNAIALSRIAAPLWLTGIALTIIGCWKTSPPQEHKRWDRWEIAVILALTLASLILRAWGADHMPYVLSGDEGSAGLTAWEFLDGRRSNILGLGWFSFPSLYFWILSLSQQFLGRSVIAIRWVSAIAGALTIPALYWTCRSLFNRRVATLSAAWLMAFHHHIFFSRVAYNNIWDGLFFVLALGALWNAWKANDRRSFLLAGLALGLAQYFYTTSHLIPILLALWMIWLARGGEGWKSRLPGIVCMVLTALSVSLPLVLLYLRHPESLFFTASRVSMLIPGWIGPAAEALGTTPLGLVFEQIWVTALGLTIAEIQGVYYGSGIPMLIGASAWIFWIGFIYCAIRFREARCGLILITILTSLLVGGLSIQAPNGQRMLLLSPILAILIASTLDRIYVFISGRWPRIKPVAAIGISLLIVLMMGENIKHLFLDYFPSENYGSVNGEVTQEIIELLEVEPPQTPLFFIGGDRMSVHSIPSLAYLLPDAHTYDLPPPYDLPHDFSPQGSYILFAILPEETAAFEKITSSHADGTTQPRYNRQGRLLFYLHKVEN
ncbi:MAG: phospholipid carrier-dependent glycosyltransferase [Anaerolineales bacterium]|nr:MAG: phospholipid carrier-dependent glycosyltransferase [Anaerolineales bacterium]